MLKVRWEKKESSFVLDVQIPVGASASVSLPFPAESVCVNGQPSQGKEVLELESGSYQIECSRYFREKRIISSGISVALR